ncbi:MAG TPA: glutamine--fructose-6-phosphate transaminase (isomerizing) [Deltaproteobacteria bacterium]|nr:glutamine--fructose-6-phosphate transaminase (isomerizing) [Deltaproteobacteria bacterium]
MCGIVGYTGPRNALDVIIDGLKRLEYRGYDSSGLVVIDGGRFVRYRSPGKIENLVSKVKESPVESHIGIGHTRWATHGRPTEENAHPHMVDGVAVVHNGIVENYLKLKEELKKEGVSFSSETDTEVLAHLIARKFEKADSLEEAVIEALKAVKGSYAIAVISTREPDKIIGARKECPLVVGIGEGEAILSSDIPAILNITRRAIFLDDGEVAVVTGSALRVVDSEGREVEKPARTIDWSPVMAEKGGYRHFMQKEIFEQPRAITDTFRGLLLEEEGDVFLNDFNIELSTVDRLYIVACGTSWHAGLVGKFLFEDLARIPTEVDLASEFRYRSPLVSERSLVIAISQSGETADTLSAVREAKKRGAQIVAITNVIESSLARESLWTFYTHAGPEIGVASTKAFTTQLVALFLLSLHTGRARAVIDRDRGMELIGELLTIPSKVEEALDREPTIKRIAKKYAGYRNFLYLARGINYPIALEGALKLKEISYIHAEGYPAGEMKHGPIALIDENMPVVVLAPKDRHYPKILANMEEVRAREGRLICVVDGDNTEAVEKAEDIIKIPRTIEQLMPIVMVIPLQLLAYHIAVLKGTDVDQPRNLAKSVTVE